MDGSALPAIDALPSRTTISEAPRAAGYRGSDFVRWHNLDMQDAGANFRSWWLSGPIRHPQPGDTGTGSHEFSEPCEGFNPPTQIFSVRTSF